jgi:hypothetical protein
VVTSARVDGVSTLADQMPWRAALAGEEVE